MGRQTSGLIRDSDRVASHPQEFDAWFETNGASDPVTFSDNIKSVERLTADAGSTPIFRVTLFYYLPRYKQTFFPSIMQEADDDFTVVAVVNALVGGVGVDVSPFTKWDLRVNDAGTPSNTIAAGLRICTHFRGSMSNR